MINWLCFLFRFLIIDIFNSVSNRLKVNASQTLVNGKNFGVLFFHFFGDLISWLMVQRWWYQSVCHVTLFLKERRLIRNLAASGWLGEVTDLPTCLVKRQFIVTVKSWVFYQFVTQPLNPWDWSRLENPMEIWILPKRWITDWTARAQRYGKG